MLGKYIDKLVSYDRTNCLLKIVLLSLLKNCPQLILTDYMVQT